MIKVLQTVLGAMLLPLLLAAPVLALVVARDAEAPKHDRLTMQAACAVVGLDCGPHEGGLLSSVRIR